MTRIKRVLIKKGRSLFPLHVSSLININIYTTSYPLDQFFLKVQGFNRLFLMGCCSIKNLLQFKNISNHYSF